VRGLGVSFDDITGGFSVLEPRFGVVGLDVLLDLEKIAPESSFRDL